MKQLLLSAFLMTALVISACDKQSNVTGPVVPANSIAQLADQLNLTDEQIGQIDEMYYMEEDISVLLTSNQVGVFDNLIENGSPGIRSDGKFDKRRVLDLRAILLYRLILKANPELSDETKQGLKDLLVQSTKTRIDIIKNNKDNPEQLKELLRLEHEALITAMKGLLTAEEIANLDALIAKIEQMRKDRRAKWVELRIKYHVEFLTKLLKLSPDQIDDIRDILKNQHAQIEILREQYKGDPEGFRSALKQLLKDTDLLIQEVLTPEQLEIWLKWKEGKLGRREGGITPGGIGHRG